MNMRTFRTLLATTVVAFATFAAGCAAPSFDEAKPEVEKEAAGEETADGDLDVTSRGDDHVTGRFTKDGTVLAFELTNRDGVHEAKLATGTGTPILTATYKDGIERLVVLGGRATVSGAVVSTEPKIEGDEKALDEVHALGELKLVAPLRKSLAAAGVSRDLFVATDMAKLKPNGAMGYYYSIPCGQFNTFPTWSWWYATWIEVHNYSYSSNAVVELRSLWNYEYQVIAPREAMGFERYYWGYSLKITNLCWWSSDPVIVKVS
jgi:hypothetical protein